MNVLEVWTMKQEQAACAGSNSDPTASSGRPPSMVMVPAPSATALESLENISVRCCQLLRRVHVCDESHNARAEILEVLARQKRLAAQKQNALNPLVALPHAVLQRICQFVGPTNCALLAQTCCDLRCYMLGNPLVWNHLDGPRPFMGRVPRTLTLAERGAAAGLRAFNFTLGDELDETAARVESLLPWVHDALLYVAPCAGDFYKQMAADPSSWRQATQPLLAPAPRLEKISLYACRHCYSSEPELPTEIFASCPPDGLRYCMLVGITLPLLGCPAFVRLKFLSYDSKHLEALALATLLRNLPRLVSLRLAVDVFELREGVDLDTLGFEASSLRNIHLGITPEPGSTVLMMCLRRVPIQRLVVPSQVWQLPAEAVKAFPPGVAVQLGPAISEFTSCAAMGGPPIPVRFVSRPHELIHLMRVPGVFLHLKSLAIHEFLWFPSWAPGNPAPSTPEVPLLRDLRILLAPPRGHLSSISFSCLTRPIPWQLPSLSTLHFSFRPCTGVPVLFIGLSDVHAFVASCIVRAPLSTLHLSGVEVVDLDAHVWLARLHDLVESTSVSATPAQACVADARFRHSSDKEAVFRDDIGAVL